MDQHMKRNAWQKIAEEMNKTPQPAPAPAQKQTKPIQQQPQPNNKKEKKKEQQQPKAQVVNITPHTTIEVVNKNEIEVDNGKIKLRKLLNQNIRIEMTDGRVLIGVFLCTDRDANVILGACSEYLKNADGETEEPRVLGLVMVPGRHIVSIQLDDTTPEPKFYNTL